jgi:Fe-Mn family superoxide dismutase
MTEMLLPRTDDALTSTAVGHELPKLPYAFGALEPVIDLRTMQLHHDQHHGAYVRNLNAALSNHPELGNRSAIWLLMNPSMIPAEIREPVAHNAGGHFNHSLFWQAMTPPIGDEPSGALADRLIHDFGSIDAFKSQFVETGQRYFGSGWVWLVRSQLNGGGLKIICTADHENPMRQGLYPIMLNDLWEHAYYLKYENRRTEYLERWWSITNWGEVARLFAASDHSAVDSWESEGGQLASAPGP